MGEDGQAGMLLMSSDSGSSPSAGVTIVCVSTNFDWAGAG